MSTDKAEHIEPTPGAPGFSGADILMYLPLLMKILGAFSAGEGTFSTKTPLGKKWIRIQSKPFAE